MSVNRILNKILSQDGVYDVFILDGPSMVRLEMEESKNCGLGCKYENHALTKSRTKDFKVCVFSKNFLESPTDMLTAMVDDEGNVFGHDVPMCMPRNKIPEGAVWATSSFVVYPNSMPKSDLKFVVLPHALSFLGEADGAANVVAFNPSRASDIFLREKFGFDSSLPNAMSTIIAMDLLDNRMSADEASDRCGGRGEETNLPADDIPGKTFSFWSRYSEGVRMIWMPW